MEDTSYPVPQRRKNPDKENQWIVDDIEDEFYDFSTPDDEWEERNPDSRDFSFSNKEKDWDSKNLDVLNLGLEDEPLNQLLGKRMTF